MTRRSVRQNGWGLDPTDGSDVQVAKRREARGRHRTASPDRGSAWSSCGLAASGLEIK